MDTASSSNQHSTISQKTVTFASNTVTISGHTWGAAGCDTASQGNWVLKLHRNMSSALKMKLTWYLQNERDTLPCDTVSHLRRKKSSIRQEGQAHIVTKCEPAHNVRFRQSWIWLFPSHCVRVKKFIEMNHLYTTYKYQLQINNWLIKRHVSALFGHHQAYKEMVLIKVHLFALPMGSHGLHWSLCLFKIIYYWLKRYNTIKCKMLCNFSILAGMDISCAVDCGDTWCLVV